MNLKMLKRFIALVILVAMIIPVLPAIDSSAVNTLTGGLLQGTASPSTSSDSWGYVGYGFKVGFSRCQQRFFGRDSNGARTRESLAQYLYDYCNDFYLGVIGGAYYYNVDGPDPQRWFQPGAAVVGKVNDGGIPITLAICRSIETGSSNEYCDMLNGRLVIKEEHTAALVQELYTANPGAAAEWLDHGGICNNPIVVCVEAVGVFKDNNGQYIGLSANDFNMWLGGPDLNGSVQNPLYMRDFGETGQLAERDGRRSTYTAAAIMQSFMATASYGQQSDSTIGSKVLKGLFGINSKTGNPYGTAGDYGYHAVTDWATNDVVHKITGCYAISIAGDPTGTTAGTDVAFLHGRYSWDLNANKIPVNARGYYEDGTAPVAKGSSVTDEFDLGYIVPDTAVYEAWYTYHKTFPISSVDVEFIVYGTGTGNGIDEYTTLYSNIIGSSSSETIVPSICKTYKVTVPGETFVEWLKTGDMNKLQFPDFNKGNSVGSTISASMVNGKVAVGFATELYATPHDAGGKHNGDRIKFGNNQVHYAVYTFNDEGRVYTLAQDTMQGFSQLKTMRLGTAPFEATTGTPTTEDMFISMGGNEFIVNMQYRYCVDDYERKYQIMVDPYANFGYYFAGEGYDHDFETSVYQNKGKDGYNFFTNATTNPTSNNTFDVNTSAKTDQLDTYEDAVDKFFEECNNLFDNLDSNAEVDGGIYPDTDYAVLIPKGVLHIEDNGTITGINEIKGNNDYNHLIRTKANLSALEEKTKALASARDRKEANSAFFAKDDTEINIDIMFMHTSRGKDYDSDAEGGVSVNFYFHSDSAKYEKDTADYRHVDKCMGDLDYTTDSRTCGLCGTKICSGHPILHTSHAVSGTLCTDYIGVNENVTINYGCGHSCSKDVDGDGDTDGDDESSSMVDHATGTTCVTSNVTHYGHKKANYDGNNKGTETTWDAPSNCKNTPNKFNDEYWAAHFKVGITPNYNVTEYEVAHDEGNRGKFIEDFQEFSQIYRDVKYMDIVECHVWRLAGGTVQTTGGLAGLMTKVTAPAPVIEAACRSLGYTLYNVEADECKGAFYNDYTTNAGEGSSGSNAWRNSGESTDVPADDDALVANNNELERIGRLANSYNGNSIAVAVPIGITDGAPIGNEEHGLTLLESDDTVVMSYNIEEQGGKSHWCFDGFFKQALALAFYDPAGRGDPGYAYRNYILVQSDFLTLGDTYSVLGFQWSSDIYDKMQGKGYDPLLAEYGLSQAIMSTDPAKAVIAIYVNDGGEFWEKRDNVKDIDVNVMGLNGWDILEPSVRGMYVTVSDTPNKPIESLASCTESGGIIQLEKDDYHRETLSEENINRGPSSDYLANFNSEGKSLSGYLAKVNDTNMLGYAGYDNKKDSVLVNEHIEIPVMGSSAFNAEATFVTGGYNGLMFTMYGVEPKTVIRNTGSLGVTSSVQVSASGAGADNKVIPARGYYPIFQNLNVIRNTANGTYGSYASALVYDECLNFIEAYAGVGSSKKTTLEAMRSNLSGIIQAEEKPIVTDLHVETSYGSDLGVENEGLALKGEGFCTSVGYGGWGSVLNDITIFNPSTAERTLIVQPSEKLPDGQNNVKDPANRDDGWTVRDQRVSTYIVGQDNSDSEVYHSYVEFDESDLPNTSMEFRYTLKAKSDMVTSFYTMSDYVTSEVTNDTWEVKPTDGDFSVTSTGTYRLTLCDAASNATSVDISLDKGDVLSTDGTSVYLSRNSESAPNVSWETLSEAVATYYQSVESVEESELSAEAIYTATKYIETHSSFAEIDYKLNRLEEMSERPVSDYYLARSVAIYNTLVDEFLTAYDGMNGTVVFNYAGVKQLFDSYILKLSAYRDRLISLKTRFDIEADTYIVNPVPIIKFEALNGVASTFKKDDRFLVQKNAVMTMDFSGLGMEKGSVVSISLPFDANYAKPADVTLLCDGDINEDYELYTVQNGNSWTWYIEAFDTMELGKMKFVFNHDANITRFPGSCVNFEKIWLLDVGSAKQTPVPFGTTIEHSYKASSNIYWEKEKRSNSINKYIFDATGIWAEVTVTKKTGVLYISTDKIQKLEMKPESVANPHKVPNANWRYYVVGWKTDKGAIITSPTDHKLFIDETVLCWPSDASGTITVGELKEQACLVKFADVYYLTTREAGLHHKILERGITVTSFDYWTLGEQNLSKLPISSAVDGSYPLLPGQVGKDLNGNLAFQDKQYEFFFDLLDTDTYLFDVQFSLNLMYRFSTDDVKLTYSDTPNNEYDYVVEEVRIADSITVTPGSEATTESGEYISLDDEFTVYFDNVGHFPGEQSWFNAGSPGNTGSLGYGWNANGIKVLNQGVGDLGIAAWYGAGDSGVGSSETVEYDEEGNIIRASRADTTECTGWIYAKYLIFQSDVYVFKDANGNMNPTCNPYDINGNLREYERVVAGEPVLLGYYTGSNEGDNGGRFVDYGAPNKTLDKNGDAFTYHFWLPLSAGESKNFKVDFITVNINDAEASYGAYTNKLPDGFTADRNYANNNNQPGVVDDISYADSEKTTAVVGRIGALTIVDTGDPRYSDSFKATDLNNNNVENYLIYPLVRRVVNYSNDFTVPNGILDRYKIGQKYTANVGSQRGFVIDPFDVRGRIANSDIWNYVKTKHTDIHGNPDWVGLNYESYLSQSYDTYGTQWFKHSITRYVRGSSTESISQQYVATVPLSSDFNKHETFANQPLKVGYEIYLSLEAIGSYASNVVSSSGTREDEYGDIGGAVNGNNDIGTRKIQIRPFYAAVDATQANGDAYNGPVDVYMRLGNSYVLINSGCDKDGLSDTDGYCKIPTHSVEEALAVLYKNVLPSYIETNTGDAIIENGHIVDYELDDTTQRRMVTDWESKITAQITDLFGYRSLLTRLDNSTDGVGGLELEASYTYGCSQFLFLRDRNRTFIGGPTAALSWGNERYETDIATKINGQKYYFGLGLPSSAVFVPHGKTFSKDNVLKTGYIINSIDVVAVGEVWTLHYESEVSKMTFEYENGELNWQEWNPWWERYPWLIPVTYYNIEDTSLDDLDTEGSH